MFEDFCGKSISLKEYMNECRRTYNKYGFKSAVRQHFWNMGGSMSTILGIRIFGNSNKNKFWFKYGIMPLYKSAKKYEKLSYWYKYRFVKRHKYNTVYTRLKPGYYDKDEIMLHACFSLLVEFIEQEHDGENSFAKFTNELADTSTYGEQDNYYNPPELMKSQYDRQSEILALYRWWKYEREQNHKLLDNLLTKSYSGDLETVPVGDDSNLFKLIDNDPPEMKQYREEYYKMQQKVEDDDQNMLHRLINVRKSLWT